jgi:hypothetical protein
VTLSRSVLGRLAAHSDSPITSVSTAFSTGDWAAQTNLSYSIVSGAFRVTGSALTRNVRYSAAGTLADCFVQAVLINGGGGSGLGVAARINAAAIPNAAITLQSPMNNSGTEQLVERSGGSIIQTNGAATVNRTGPLRYGLNVRGTGAQSRTFVGTPVDRALTGIALTAAGDPGVYHSAAAQTTNVQQFYVMRDRYLRVTGPSGAGWRARVLDAGGNVLAQADEAGGIADIDLWTVQFPEATRIQVLDISSSTVWETEDPTERVWGGDAWTFALTPAGTPVVSNPTMTTLDVAWAPAAGALSYRVERATNPAGSWTDLGTKTSPFTDTGLTANTTYYYRVYAVHPIGESAASANGSATTANVPPPDAPDAPTVDNATPTTLDVSWAPVSGATSYRVERAETLVGSWTDLGTQTSPFTDTGLAFETSYSYRVYAVNAGGESAPSGANSLSTTLPPGVPTAAGAPAVIAVSRTAATIRFRRLLSATRYEVQIKPLLSGSFTEVYDGPGDPDDRLDRLQASFGDLTTATAYQVRLRGCSSSGCGNWSPGIEFETAPEALPPDVPVDPVVPGAPTGLWRRRVAWVAEVFGA